MEDKPKVWIIILNQKGGAAQIPQSTNWLNKYCIIETIAENLNWVLYLIFVTGTTSGVRVKKFCQV